MKNLYAHSEAHQGSQSITVPPNCPQEPTTTIYHYGKFLWKYENTLSDITMVSCNIIMKGRIDPKRHLRDNNLEWSPKPHIFRDRKFIRMPLNRENKLQGTENYKYR